MLSDVELALLSSVKLHCFLVEIAIGCKFPETLVAVRLVPCFRAIAGDYQHNALTKVRRPDLQPPELSKSLFFYSFGLQGFVGKLLLCWSPLTNLM